MPHPKEVPIRSLHPTQLTVGLAEVRQKRERLSKLAPAEQRAFMEQHVFPAALGPGGALFLTDHHHLGRAALEAGVATAHVDVQADLSGLAGDAFWEEMNARAWVHPLDENGVRHRYARIPHRLDDLVDDVYRSLAGFVRANDGYAKSPSPFTEFEWADFFRRLIPIEDVHADLDAAVALATRLARSDRAKRMPGYHGK